MKKYLISFISGMALFMLSTHANADFRVGATGILGQFETSGSESEKSGDVGPETNSVSITERFIGASVFAEVDVGPFVLGVDWVPVDVELGSGRRTDTTTDGNESSSDSGSYKAEANAENLMTIYAHVPLSMINEYAYLSAGYHYTDVTTTETLPNSTYGDDEITGYQLGLGFKGDHVRMEAFYSDFDDVSLSSSSGSSSVTADIDSMGVKLGFNF